MPRLGNRRGANRSREIGKKLPVLWTDGHRIAIVTGVKVGGQSDEVCDGDIAIIIDIALLPGAGLVEMGGELNEVGDGDVAVEIEVAQAGETHEDHWVPVRIESLRH